jgi:toxin FitB
MMWLLDTNIISETNKSRPSVQVMAWLGSVAVEHLFISTVSIAELRVGIAAMPEPAIASQVLLWLENAVRPRFADRVLAPDEDCLMKWRVISKSAQRDRQPTPPVDLLIAAIALTHEMGVTTRDVTPFLGTGVPVLNPFTGERFNGA